MTRKIKICGVTSPEQINMLDELSVAYAGLWYGIPKGRHNLDLKNLVNIASTPRKNIELILVTVESDICLLAEAVSKGVASRIQFHGFQLPTFIKLVKRTLGDSIKIFKVLHVRGGKCIEADFMSRYIDAGVDYFIIDSFQDSKNIGSTGLRISDEFLEQFLSTWKINSTTMIAGGIDETVIDSLREKHQPYGFDIDSSARVNGIIDRQRICRIMSQ